MDHFYIFSNSPPPAVNEVTSVYELDVRAELNMCVHKCRTNATVVGFVERHELETFNSLLKT